MFPPWGVQNGFRQLRWSTTKHSPEVDTSAETGPPLGHYTILTFNGRKEDDWGNFIMTPVEKFSTGTWQRAKSCFIISVPNNVMIVF